MYASVKYKIIVIIYNLKYMKPNNITYFKYILNDLYNHTKSLI